MYFSEKNKRRTEALTMNKCHEIFSFLAYVYKFLYSEVFNQPKVVEQAKAMLRKSDTLYYGVKGVSMQK